MAKKDNKEKNPVGRPLKYKNVKEMADKIDLFFDDPSEAPYTVTGLCLYLNLSNEGLIEYGKRGEYSETVKRAKSKIEDYINKEAMKNGINTAMAIFNLKNNFSWNDKGREQQEFEREMSRRKMEIEERKLALLEKQYMDMDEDIEYVVEEEKYEKED